MTSFANFQRHYVLFGIELDRDEDALDMAIHLWPFTWEISIPSLAKR